MIQVSQKSDTKKPLTFDLNLAVHFEHISLTWGFWKSEDEYMVGRKENLMEERQIMILRNRSRYNRIF